MRCFLIICISIIALISEAQSPIFNYNNENTVILNPASASSTPVLNINSDNIYEYYNKNKLFFTSNLNAYTSSIKNISLGLNALYDFQFGDNSNFSFSVFSAYHYTVKKNNIISGGISVEYNQITIQNEYSDLRYSDQKIYTSFLSENKAFNLINFDAGIKYLINADEIGISICNIGLKNFPDSGSEKLIPQQLNAYIRKSIFHRILMATLISQNQRRTRLIEFENDFINLSYLGLDIDYSKFNLLRWGVSYKQLFNGNSIYGIYTKFNTYQLTLSCALSIMPTNDKIALFNQISVNYCIEKNKLTKTYLGGRFLN